MFFKGTERRADGAHDLHEIDAIGGEFNAFNGQGADRLLRPLRFETRDVALDVLTTCSSTRRFDEGEIAKEKG
jgi:predicted Zn-dependent peptidase